MKRAAIVKNLALYVEEHTAPGAVRFDGSQRWRQRIDCEHHGRVVPVEHRCGLCGPAEPAGRVLRLGKRSLPQDYLEYLFDRETD